MSVYMQFKPSNMKQLRTQLLTTGSNRFVRFMFLAAACIAAGIVITVSQHSTLGFMATSGSFSINPARLRAGFPSFCEVLPPLDAARWSTKLRSRFGPSASSAAAAAVAGPAVSVYQAAELSLALGLGIWNQQNAKAHQQSILQAELNTTAVLEHIGPYPAAAFNGRGIVIVGGGPAYSPPAYACVTFIRKTGCLLPIEVWTPPHEPIPAGVVSQFEALGAAVRNLGDVYPQQMHHKLLKFVSKPAAVLASSFREVLLLDSDNIPLADPTYLFDHELYLSSGLLMWPDFWPCQAKPSAFSALGIPAGLRPRGSHESGQLLLDKQRGWRPLLLTLYLNLHGDVFYPMLSSIGQGDKETYPYAWLSLAAASRWDGQRQLEDRLSAGYGLVPFGVMALGVWEKGSHNGFAMLQRGPEGGALFVHAHMPKVNLRVEGGFDQRRWVNLTGEVTVLPPKAKKEFAVDYRLLNAVAGYDVERVVHKLRQQLRCDSAWVECCLPQ